MLKFFNTRWDKVPTIWVDVETTGVLPGVDAAVDAFEERARRSAP